MACFPGTSKGVIVWEWGNLSSANAFNLEVCWRHALQFKTTKDDVCNYFLCLLFLLTNPAIVYYPYCNNVYVFSDERLEFVVGAELIDCRV